MKTTAIEIGRLMCYFYRLVIAIGLTSIAFAGNLTDFKCEIDEYQDDNMKNIIKETLQEINQDLDQSIHLELLKNHPEAIPTLAEWIYEDWHPYDKSLTKERLIEGYKQRFNDNQIPFTILAIKNSKPIGVISLKLHQQDKELADLENGCPWVGSLHVISEERGQGIGESLAKAVTTIAKKLGHKELRFYLSESKGVNWCIKRGAEIIETRPFRGHTITILRFDLNK